MELPHGNPHLTIWQLNTWSKSSPQTWGDKNPAAKILAWNSLSPEFPVGTHPGEHQSSLFSFPFLISLPLWWYNLTPRRGKFLRTSVNGIAYQLYLGVCLHTVFCVSCLPQLSLTTFFLCYFSMKDARTASAMLSFKITSAVSQAPPQILLLLIILFLLLSAIVLEVKNLSWSHKSRLHETYFSIQCECVLKMRTKWTF